MVDPVSQSRDFAGQGRQAPGDEIAERLTACIDVAAVAVNEIHRHVEHVVDVTLEPKTWFENKRQGSATVGVGVSPDITAMTQQTRRLALDKRRVGEQRHRHRLQCQAYPEFFDHVGFGLVVEVGLHRAGAQHHVEAEPPFFRHVIAHDPVARLGHPRNVFAPPFRIEAEPEHAEPEFVANLTHLAQMLVHLVAGLMHAFERRAAQFELSARFEGDRTLGVVRQRDRVAVFDDGFPAEASHSLQQCGDAIRPFIGHSASIGAPEDEFLVFGPDPPCRRRLRPGIEVFDELSLVGDRFSGRARRGCHSRRNSLDIWAGRISSSSLRAKRQALTRRGRGANRLRSPATPPAPRAQPYRRATPWARARRE